MNNLVNVNWDSNVLEFPGRREILLTGKCKGILPVNMISGGSLQRGIYNIAGYRKISSLDKLDSWQVLHIVEKVLECIEICRDYLIFPDEYVVSAETLYVCEDMSDVKLLYIPSEKNCSEDMHILMFIYSLRRRTTENGKTYLDTLGKMLECSNIRLPKVMAFIRELKHEVNLYEIK